MFCSTVDKSTALQNDKVRASPRHLGWLLIDIFVLTVNKRSGSEKK